MDDAQKVEVAGRLGAIISTFETSDDAAQLASAKEELAEVWPRLLEAVPVIGKLVSNAAPRGAADIQQMTPEQIREKLLPALQQFHKFLAGAESGGGNVPTRPGCMGGTGALLALAIFALSQLVR